MGNPSVQAVLPEAGDALPIGEEIPGVSIEGNSAPHQPVFLPGAHTGLIVGGAHDDAQLTGQSPSAYKKYIKSIENIT